MTGELFLYAYIRSSNKNDNKKFHHNSYGFIYISSRLLCPCARAILQKVNTVEYWSSVKKSQLKINHWLFGLQSEHKLFKDLGQIFKSFILKGFKTKNLTSPNLNILSRLGEEVIEGDWFVILNIIIFHLQLGALGPKLSSEFRLKNHRLRWFPSFNY